MKKKIFLAIFGFFLILFLTNVASAEIIPADRKIDWNPGIPGGIPNYSIGANVLDYGAIPNDGLDDAQAIKDAIIAAPAGTAVYFPEGVYEINSSIEFTKRITLRGDGMKKTIINSNIGWRPIGMGSGNKDYNYIDVISGHTKGSTEIVVADSSRVSEGDYFIIDQENDPEYVSILSSEVGECTYCGQFRCSTNNNIGCNRHGNSCDNGLGVCVGGQRALGFVIKVIAKNGNTLTLDQGLYWDFKDELDPQIGKINGMKEYLGIEDLKIFQTKEHIWGTITMSNCAYCWLKNVEIENTGGYAVWNNSSYKNEFRGNYIHHASCYTSDHAYGFSLGSHVTDALVEDNIFDYLNYPVSRSISGAGTVIAYNYLDNPTFAYGSCNSIRPNLTGEIGAHGAHPIHNLYESNVLHAIWADMIHGSSSHMTIFRNRVKGYLPYITSNLYSLNIAYNSRYYTVLGNVLGVPDYHKYELEKEVRPNCWYEPYNYFLGYKSSITCKETDPLVKQTLLRHGNYDYSNNSLIWDANISDQTIPNSLYLDEKPSWFGNMDWPAIGPTQSGVRGLSSAQKPLIPAQARYKEVLCGNGKVDTMVYDYLGKEMIIDDTSPQTTFIGEWNKESCLGYYVSGCKSNLGVGQGEKSVEYRPNIVNAGYYWVLINRPVYKTNWAFFAPLELKHANGTENMYFIQDRGEFPWQSLGVHYFNAGNEGYVKVKTDGTTGLVIADAIKMVQVYAEVEECDDGNDKDGDGCSSTCKIDEGKPDNICGNGKIESYKAKPIIVDNLSPTFYNTGNFSTTGNWTGVSSSAGFYGLNYLHDGNTGKGIKSAKFEPTINEPGEYAAYIQYTSHSNRASNVPVKIVYANGTTDKTINQQTGGGQWNYLGNFQFAQGNYIEIQTTGTTGYVIVDAIKLEKVGNTIEQCDDGDLDAGDGCSSECKLEGPIQNICEANTERYSDAQINFSKGEWFSGQISLAELLKRIKIWKYCN